MRLKSQYIASGQSNPVIHAMIESLEKEISGQNPPIPQHPQHPQHPPIPQHPQHPPISQHPQYGINPYPSEFQLPILVECS